MPLKEFVQRFPGIDEFVRELNDFHRTIAPGPLCSHRALVAYSTDHTVKWRLNPSIREELAIRCSIAAFNMQELARSRLKRRPKVFRRANRFDVMFDGDVSINFVNGTVVVLGRTTVRKFFFKDVDFFVSLYGDIAKYAGVDKSISGGIFSIKQQRYQPIGRNVPGATLWRGLRTQLDSYHGLADVEFSNGTRFSPRQKLLQLAKFHELEGHRGLEGYLSVVEQLAARVERSRLALCHGDLWRENIVADARGRPVAIDFDKTVRFCAGYDGVYFCLMDCMASKRLRIEDLVEALPSLSVRELSLSIMDNADLLSGVDDQEMRLCALFFATLKLAEQDFHRREMGSSVSILNEGLKSL